VVTDDDKSRLQDQLFQQLKQQAYERLTERLAAGAFVPADSVSYLAMSPTFTPFVGDVSPQLSLSMSVQAVGLVVDTTSGDGVALQRLEMAMPPGSRLVADSVHYIPGSVTVQSDTAVGFSITVQGTLLRAIDTARARNTIAGMTPSQAVAALKDHFALASDPRIELGPDWLPMVVPTRVPSLPWRIRVDVDWDTATQIALRH
jgi:hypothetical protein